MYVCAEREREREIYVKRLWRIKDGKNILFFKFLNFFLESHARRRRAPSSSKLFALERHAGTHAQVRSVSGFGRSGTSYTKEKDSNEIQRERERERDKI